ncbi:MAG: hypothetical protein V4706_13980 [Pseudomonadota bacterium]
MAPVISDPIPTENNSPLALLQPQVTALGAIYAQCVADQETSLALVKAVNAISAIERIVLPLDKSIEFPVYAQSMKELQLALLSAATGNYRQAFTSLRLFFELFLSGIEFSASIRLFLGWKLGRENIVWNRLVDKEQGIFSKSFCGLFFEDLVEETLQYRTMACTVFSECSQYVHGNPSSTAKLPQSLMFQRETVLEWALKLDTMHLVVSFAYASRYLMELDDAQKEIVKHDLLDQLGTIESVRLVLGGAAGG